MGALARKIVVVTRPTRLEQLIKRFNTKAQARFYIERLGGDFRDYEREQGCFDAALEAVLGAARKAARVHRIDWLQSAGYRFAPDDLIATVGQDGLIVNTLKYLDAQPVIGFNPEPGRWDGMLAQFDSARAAESLSRALAGTLPERLVTKAEARLSDSQRLLAVNDFFLGVADHGSARYRLRHGEREENQSSSGLIVSTPLGRSGWLRSIVNGARGIARNAGTAPEEEPENEAETAAGGTWDDEVLHYAVREPYRSVSSGDELVFGTITADAPLTVESRMGEKGLIFSDGVQTDYLAFNYSVRATFAVAAAKGRVLVRD